MVQDELFKKWYFLKARSVKCVNKNTNDLLALKSTLIIDKLNVFAINESRLNNSVTDDELAVEGYTVYRKDRPSRYGGILLYINNDFQCQRRIDIECPSTSSNEILVVELSLANTCKMALILVYRPPHFDKKKMC